MKRVDYEYYEWLVSQIHIPNGKIYSELFELMHNTEFVWLVPNDNNRLQDGLDLREQFMATTTEDLDQDSLAHGGVTFLEVLIALSRRLEFTAGGEAAQWAWRLIKNLHLHKMFNPMTRAKTESAEFILHRVIWRQYSEDGSGGFFPLNRPTIDQTKVEIWYQMNSYAIEMQES